MLEHLQEQSIATAQSGHGTLRRLSALRAYAIAAHSSAYCCVAMQGGDATYVQLADDSGQPMGFAYGPPAVPFAPYATYQGAMYPFLAQRPSAMAAGMAPPHSYPPNVLISVSPMAPKSGSPHGGPIMFAPPFMGRPPPEGGGGSLPAPWGMLPHPPAESRNLRSSRRPHGSNLQTQGVPQAAEMQSNQALGPSSPHHAHRHGSGGRQQPELASPPRHQRQHSAPQQHDGPQLAQGQAQPPDGRAVSSPEPAMVGPDGQPLKLNARCS